MNKIEEFIDELRRKDFIRFIIDDLGGVVYVVGGATRDLILNKPNKDIDLIVREIPIDNLISGIGKFGRVDVVGKSFGVIKFIDGDGTDFDVALPRKEKPNGDGGYRGFDIQSDENLPIEDDLIRRDAKFNAMAININTGKFIDPLGGLDDIENNVISSANPDAFSDDPLRMLRIIGFSSRFGFNIEPETAKLIHDNASRVREIAPERILIEFDKIIQKGDISKGAFLLKDLGLTPHIFGGDAGLYTGDKWGKVKTMAEFIFLLGSHLTQDIAEFYKTKLKGDVDTYKELKALQFAFNADENADPVAARSIAHNVFRISANVINSEIIPDVIKRAGQELNSGKYPKSFNELAVNGNDLMDMGLKGKEIGDTLKSLLLKVYGDNVQNDRDTLLGLAKGGGEETIKEGSHNDRRPKSWVINNEPKTVDFFVDEYHKWNKQNTEPAYKTPSKASVLEFLQNNYEDESTDEKLRNELYWGLTDNDLFEEEVKKKRVLYSAVVLDEESRTKLIQVFQPMIPEDWEVIAHHMTINMGEIDDMYSSLLGQEARLKVTSYAMDDLVMAVGVKGAPTVNNIPHITIAVNRAGGGKPYLSNKLNDWKEINFSIELKGVVTEVTE